MSSGYSGLSFAGPSPSDVYQDYLGRYDISDPQTNYISLNEISTIFQSR